LTADSDQHPSGPVKYLAIAAAAAALLAALYFFLLR
jgi:hypothetical protein